MAEDSYGQELDTPHLARCLTDPVMAKEALTNGLYSYCSGLGANSDARDVLCESDLWCEAAALSVSRDLSLRPFILGDWPSPKAVEALNARGFPEHAKLFAGEPPLQPKVVKVTCGNCMFFKPTVGNQGECRRYPPAPKSAHNGMPMPEILCEFPVTHDFLFCGEWKLRNTNGG